MGYKYNYDEEMIRVVLDVKKFYHEVMKQA